MKEVLEVIRNRHSVRSYRPSEVSYEDLSTILRAGNLAPTRRNRQNLLFVGIRDRERLSRIRELLGGGTELYGAPAFLLVLEREPDALSVQNASAAMENMMLQATSLGLGSCWIHCVVARLNERKESLQAILSLDYPYTVLETLVVGEEDGRSSGKERRDENVRIL